MIDHASANISMHTFQREPDRCSYQQGSHVYCKC